MANDLSAHDRKLLHKSVKHLDKDLLWYHEVIDRLTIVNNIIDNNLLEHPIIKKNKSWLKLIEQAQCLLTEVYLEAAAT